MAEQPSSQSSNKYIIGIVAIVVVAIVIIGSYRAIRRLGQNQFQARNSMYAVSPAPITSGTTTTSGGTSVPVNASDVQLDQEAQQIQDSLNKLDLERTQIDQGINSQSQDTPPQQ